MNFLFSLLAVAMAILCGSTKAERRKFSSFQSEVKADCWLGSLTLDSATGTAYGICRGVNNSSTWEAKDALVTVDLPSGKTTVVAELREGKAYYHLTYNPTNDQFYAIVIKDGESIQPEIQMMVEMIAKNGKVTMLAASSGGYSHAFLRGFAGDFVRGFGIDSDGNVLAIAGDKPVELLSVNLTDGTFSPLGFVGHLHNMEPASIAFTGATFYGIAFDMTRGPDVCYWFNITFAEPVSLSIGDPCVVTTSKA